MYTLSKGSPTTNKLLVKTRRGISQKLDLDTQKDPLLRQCSKEPLPEISSPKPVFQRKPHQRSTSTPEQTISPQHEEMIKYIRTTWKCVKQEYEQAVAGNCLDVDNGSSSGQQPQLMQQQCPTTAKKVAPKVCRVKSSSSLLSNFEPFDLETYWGRRLFETLTQDV